MMEGTREESTFGTDPWRAAGGVAPDLDASRARLDTALDAFETDLVRVCRAAADAPRLQTVADRLASRIDTLQTALDLRRTEARKAAGRVERLAKDLERWQQNAQ